MGGHRPTTPRAPRGRKAAQGSRRPGNRRMHSKAGIREDGDHHCHGSPIHQSREVLGHRAKGKGGDAVRKPHRAQIPVIAECVKTGKITHFGSLAETSANGFSQSCVTRCIRGISVTGIHAGHKWTTPVELSPPRPSALGDKIRALIADGKSANQIAKLLGCSLSTVDYHRYTKSVCVNSVNP